MIGNQTCKTLGLVVGERVHRIEDECFHSGDAGSFGAQYMIENWVEKCFGLAGARAGGDEGWLRAGLEFGGEPFKGAGLVSVGSEAVGPPIEVHAPVSSGWRKRESQPHIGTLEHSRFRVAYEVAQRSLRVGVGERERSREIVGEPLAQVLGLEGWK